jgi:pimeloyl-ACP methyl ester carboxylesterase
MDLMQMREGTLARGLPYRAFGSGPPLVVLPGLTGHHRIPTRLEMTAELPGLKGLARKFTVHVVQRRPGLPAGTTMTNLADDVAAVIRASFGEAVPVLGMSTGGSVALKLAVDHPDLVSRLVLGCAAMRLSDEARHRCLRLAELTVAGRPRSGWAQLSCTLAATPITRGAAAAVLWLKGGPDSSEAGDLIVTIHAEVAFDVGGHLAKVAAPTLVVGGGRDASYSTELFYATARGIPDGHLLLYPRSGHLSTLTHRSARRAIGAFLAGEEWR